MCRCSSGTADPKSHLVAAEMSSGHGALGSELLRAQSFVSCAVLEYRRDLLVCVPSLSRLWGRDISGLRRRPNSQLVFAVPAVLLQGLSILWGVP